MRILHVILSRGFKGSERSAAEYCNYLHSQGHHVGIVVARDQAVRRSHGRVARVEGIEHHLDAGLHVLRMPRQLFALRALQKLVDGFAPDIVHAHLKRAARLVARLQTRALTVGTLHMHHFDREYLGLDAILCVAQWQQKLIPDHYAGRVMHVPNIIQAHRTLAPGEREALRRELGIAQVDYVIGGIGQLVERKGWDVLIRAFHEAALPHSRLLILGEGKHRRKLARMADDRLLLPGYRANARDYLQVMDLYVSAAREEAFGLSILEALEAGLPVIASDAQGCREILGALPGDLFPIDDVAGLRDLLIAHQRARTPRKSIDVSKFLAPEAGRALLQAYSALLQR